ncbi:threonine aldolase family protein [Flavihumibacter sp. UBA7668]|uniref:threonine aldolase family protein n=1 Tax=Flavihumibacter sp. UBA7668 TaxID=1946542 RepID=UPI0025BDD702|nr:aminotransferase class I/II-fold pyridoxal phosphate-dependent enzyme [Flavihumibacter sp. UBA7668]
MDKGNRRRFFLKSAGLGLLPAMLPSIPGLAQVGTAQQKVAIKPIVKFFGDGDLMEPDAYLRILNELQAKGKVGKDRYGIGGSVEDLEKEMAKLTGMEKAIFLPSGTMANQLAISLLSGDRAKVYLQDLSHIYRDEADAAQTVFSKRLVPLGMGKAFFTVEELKFAIEGLPSEEVFASGIGAVSIENPIRRADGQQVPLEEIKAISAYCREKKIPLHLDGARLFMAAAWSGNSIREYAQYFDTVYISLYKYLGASSGAILCGKESLISQVPHLMKVHGGSMYGNWTNAAMALHKLEGFEDKLKRSIRAFVEISEGINKLPDCSIQPIPGGTNIYFLQLPQGINGPIFQKEMREAHGVWMGRPDKNGRVPVTVNETLLYRSPIEVVTAIRNSVKKATNS